MDIQTSTWHSLNPVLLGHVLKPDVLMQPSCKKWSPCAIPGSYFHYFVRKFPFECFLQPFIIKSLMCPLPLLWTPIFICQAPASVYLPPTLYFVRSTFPYRFLFCLSVPSTLFNRLRQYITIFGLSFPDKLACSPFLSTLNLHLLHCGCVE